MEENDELWMIQVKEVLIKNSFTDRRIWKIFTRYLNCKRGRRIREEKVYCKLFDLTEFKCGTRGRKFENLARRNVFLRIVNSSWNLQSEMCTTSLGYFRLISIRINIGSGLIRCNRIIIKKYFDTSLLLRFSNDWTTSSTTIFIDGCKLAVRW